MNSPYRPKNAHISQGHHPPQSAFHYNDSTLARLPSSASSYSSDNLKHHRLRKTTRPPFKPPKKLVIPLWTLQTIISILVILKNTLPSFTHLPKTIPKHTRDSIQGTHAYYVAGSAVTLVLSALDILLYALRTRRYKPLVALGISILQFCIVFALAVGGFIQIVGPTEARLTAIYTTFNILILLIFILSLLTKSIYYHRYRLLQHVPFHSKHHHSTITTRPRAAQKPAETQHIFDQEFADFLCNPHALNRHLLERSPNCNIDARRGASGGNGGVGGTVSRACSPATTWWRAEMEGIYECEDGDGRGGGGVACARGSGDLERASGAYYSSRRYSRESGCSTIMELDGEDVEERGMHGSDGKVRRAS